MSNKDSRSKIIMQTSLMGIGGNIVLVALKMIIGLMANSIAIILDAVNNLTDALSSIITIVMTKLSNKPADKKHPYGYGRMEYFGTALISFLILYAGIKAFVSSIERIISPEPTTYSAVTIIIVCIGIVAKVIIGRYFKKQGKLADSISLTASGTDALMDAILSCGTLVSIVVALCTSYTIDGYIGIIISVFIVKAGVELLGDTLSTILGRRVDGQLTKEIKDAVKSHGQVKGAYDLVLHNYGPMQHVGTVNIEVDESLTARDIFTLSKEINRDIMERFGIYMTVGIYALNAQRGIYADLERNIRHYMHKQKYVLGVHALYVDAARSIISFDVVIDFDAKDGQATRDKYAKELHRMYPQWRFELRVDRAFSD